MRNQLYKVRLRFEHGTLPVTVACLGIENLEATINSELSFYKIKNGEFYGLVLDGTQITANMTDEEYEAELMHCDIVQKDTNESFFTV